MLWWLEHYTHLCNNHGMPYLLQVCSHLSTRYYFSLHSINEEPVVQRVKEPAHGGPVHDGRRDSES